MKFSQPTVILPLIYFQLSLLIKQSNCLMCIQCDSEPGSLKSQCISGRLAPVNCTNPADDHCVTTTVTVSKTGESQVTWRSCGKGHLIPRCSRLPISENPPKLETMTRSPHKNLEQKSLPKDYGAGENVSEAPESINFLLLCKAGCTKDGCIPPLPNSAIKLRYMRISPLVVVILALLSCETT